MRCCNARLRYLAWHPKWPSNPKRTRLHAEMWEAWQVQGKPARRNHLSTPALRISPPQSFRHDLLRFGRALSRRPLQHREGPRRTCCRPRDPRGPSCERSQFGYHRVCKRPCSFLCPWVAPYLATVPRDRVRCEFNEVVRTRGRSSQSADPSPGSGMRRLTPLGGKFYPRSASCRRRLWREPYPPAVHVFPR